MKTHRTKPTRQQPTTRQLAVMQGAAFGFNRAATVSVLMLCTLAFPSQARAQGWVVDDGNRPTTLLLTEHDVRAEVNHQVASVNVTAAFRNRGRSLVEGYYLFPLPRHASVSSFKLEIDGKAVSGEILAADKARRTYESIVRNALDPALLEWVDGAIFRARIFPIEAGETRRISLAYDIVLDRTGDVVTFSQPLTGTLGTRGAMRPRPHPSVRTDDADGRKSGNIRGESIDGSIRLHISSDADVRNVYSPTHDVKVERADGETEVYTTGPLEAHVRNFVLHYSLSRDHLAATFFTHRPYETKAGYFMVLLDPPVRVETRQIQPRDVIFIIDTSGSMAGDKIEQAKAALSYAIQRLGPRDRFGIVAFSSDVNRFAPALGSKAQADDALYFISQLEARGGTNIDGALESGLEMIDDDRSSTVVLLTDGMPSTGVTDVPTILSRSAANNPSTTPIFSFGVGYDVNTNLLDGLAKTSNAFADYILPEENIEEEISTFYERIRYPVMTDIEVDFAGVPVSELAPHRPGVLFLGDALVLTGRYRNGGRGTLEVSGTINDEHVTQRLELDFPDVDRESDFVARVWATRRIGELLETIRLEGESDALVDEVISLAREFGIVTPYTSYLVAEDEARFAETRTIEHMVRDLGVQGAAASAEQAGFDRAAVPQSTGRDAVHLSKRIAALKQVNHARQDVTAPLLNVMDQTFVQTNGGTWKTQEDASGLPTWQVKFASDAYFDFARMYPEAGAFLQLGDDVSFVFRNQLVKVDATGSEKISAEELRSRFAG